jgi:hypothetical protein
MRRISRVVTVAMLLIGIAPMVAGCADDFDMDKLDVLGLNKKKPLPGKREALFPNGVPGVEQGIPPEYMKGNVAEQTGAAVPVGPLTPPAAGPNAQTASAAPAAEQAKEKPKAKPKKRVAARPKPTRVRIAPKPGEQPAEAQQQPAQPAQTQQGMAPWPTQNQSVPAPWPSAPPPGTFSKQ